MSELAELARVRALCASGHARLLRTAKRISLSEVATEVGVDPATISRWERGLRLPRGDDARAYLAILDQLGRG